MKKGKKGSFLESKENRTIIIVLEVAVLLTIVIITCAVLQGDIVELFEETTMYVLQNQQTTEEEYVYGTQFVSGDDGATEKTSSGGESVAYNYTGSVFPGLNNQQTQGSTGNTLSDPSGWSKSQIIKTAADAVNKTKAYKNNLTVHHKETFNATVTECTGGGIVQSVANVMVGWVVKPVDETLNYSNGYAKNSEGETVPIILPKRGNFSLSESGVTSANVRRSGNSYVIKLQLVPESVGIGEVPVNNAGSVGYLDVANFDISFMEVDSADITYKGSSIELHINEQGYVTYAVYKVPLEIEGSAHKGSISGSATFVGEQSEVWTLNY